MLPQYQPAVACSITAARVDMPVVLRAGELLDFPTEQRTVKFLARCGSSAGISNQHMVGVVRLLFVPFRFVPDLDLARALIGPSLVVSCRT